MPRVRRARPLSARKVRIFRKAQLADPRLASVPVVVCSGDGRLDEKAEALGVVDRLPKPIDQRALLSFAALHCSNLEAGNPPRAPSLN